MEISGGVIRDNEGPDAYSCGVNMNGGVLKVSGNPVIVNNGQNGTCNAHANYANEFVLAGNLTEGANIGVYSESLYLKNNIFGSLSTAGYTGTAYIHNDRDSSLAAVASGTDLVWKSAVRNGIVILYK